MTFVIERHGKRDRFRLIVLVFLRWDSYRKTTEIDVYFDCHYEENDSFSCLRIRVWSRLEGEKTDSNQIIDLMFETRISRRIHESLQE